MEGFKEDGVVQSYFAEVKAISPKEYNKYLKRLILQRVALKIHPLKITAGILKDIIISGTK